MPARITIYNQPPPDNIPPIDKVEAFFSRYNMRSMEYDEDGSLIINFDRASDGEQAREDMDDNRLFRNADTDFEIEEEEEIEETPSSHHFEIKTTLPFRDLIIVIRSLYETAELTKISKGHYDVEISNKYRSPKGFSLSFLEKTNKRRRED